MVKHTLPPSESSIPKNRAVIWKAVSSERQAHEDKVSLEEQEKLAREWCDNNGYDVIQVLEIPGYSRRESDIITAFEDFAEQGNYAYSDLRRMWQNDEFDVLIAYSHDRLGRSNTLHSYVIENIIQHGKQIYLLADGGFVNSDDFRYKLAIGGMMAATPIDRLIKASAVAKDKLITQGLPTGPRMPLSHRVVRDPESGKALYMELREEHGQLFQDLAEIFLDGVAYNLLSHELYKRYGHTAPNGKPYRANLFFDLLWTPTFWGHLARRYTVSSANGNKRGAWIFDETVEPPTGVTVARNVIPAVYTGDIADTVKAELYRRMDMYGNRKPRDTYRYSGLFICGECGSSMSTRSKPKYGRVGLRCSRVHNRVMDDNFCTQNRMIPHRTLQARMENFLEQLVAGLNPEVFQYDEEQNDETTRLKKLVSEQTTLQNKMNVLITELSDAPETARPHFRQQIERLSIQLERVNEDVNTLQHKLEEDEYRTREEGRTIDELKSLTLECFWNLPDREINQWIRRLMGKRKFVVMNREIIGTMKTQPRRRKSGRES